MKRTILSKLFALGIAAGACVTPLLANGEDIDIFGGPGNDGIKPRILIVLDNTSNWSRHSQKWPGGVDQGTSEVEAISEVVANMTSDVKIGLMEFVTGGTANDDGGFVRYHVREMNDTNKLNFTKLLGSVETYGMLYGNGITRVQEKRNSNTPYGNLMYDVYSYLAGGSSLDPTAVTSVADPAGYVAGSSFSRFVSPLTAAEVCAKTYVIFIGNSDSNGPTPDEQENTDALNLLSGNAGGANPVPQLSLPNFTTGAVINSTLVRKTAECHATPAAAFTVEVDPRYNINTNAACWSASEKCVVGAPTTLDTPIACPSGQLSYTVTQATFHPATTNTTAPTNTVGTTVATIGTTSVTYASDALAQAAVTAGTETGGMACPANTTSTVLGTTTATSYACTYVLGAANGTAYTDTNGYITDQCYSGSGTGLNQWNYNAPQEFGNAPACPAGQVCTYPFFADAGSSGGCGTQRKVVFTQRVYNKRTYAITRRVTPTVTVTYTTSTPAYTDYVNLGRTAACYPSAPTSATGDFAAQCTGTNISCTYGNAPTSNTVASCPAGTNVYEVNSLDKVITNVAIRDSATLDTNTFNADEWSRFMYQKGVPVSGSGTVRGSVATYTVDVYNAQPNAQQTSLLLSMANNGGGKYFLARSKGAIKSALEVILTEIQAENSAFASTSLPVNATNRSQNLNQVFIGMFRPDKRAKPRWFGNLKRYQLILDGTNVTLGDATGASAVNPTTGFITPCAKSYWTTNTTAYWSGVTYGLPAEVLDPSAESKCLTNALKYSDAPDGSQVEKGAAAQMLRGTSLAARKMYTRVGNELKLLNTDNVLEATLNATTLNFIRGGDVNGEKAGYTNDTFRPSVHGDVIHSRPLPVNYGGETGVTVFYGANDGAFHAINADTGAERWSFVAPEHFGKFERLQLNSPTITTSDRKGYFFDGSTGLYQNRDSSKVWVFPSMRRGGRMVYGLNVSNAATPTFMWRVGCDEAGGNCTSNDFANIGQTWSTPTVAFIKGMAQTDAANPDPIVIFGGGYDSCEDLDSATPNCAATKGNRIFIVNARTGAFLKSFDTERAVAADIALTDVNGDGYPDYAYAADTGGAIYRIDFAANNSAAALTAGLDKDAWKFRKIAHTTGSSRKFLYAPSLFYTQNTVYIALGSGDRERPLIGNYPYTSRVVNRFYVYLDRLPTNTAEALVADAILPLTPFVNSFDLDSVAMQNHSEGTICTTPAAYPSAALRLVHRPDRVWPRRADRDVGPDCGRHGDLEYQPPESG